MAEKLMQKNGFSENDLAETTPPPRLSVNWETQFDNDFSKF